MSRRLLSVLGKIRVVNFFLGIEKEHQRMCYARDWRQNFRGTSDTTLEFSRSLSTRLKIVFYVFKFHMFICLTVK
jgi:hypothetical protein